MKYDVNDGEDFTTNQDAEFDYEKCNHCKNEAKHYFKKFNEWLCEDCYNLAIQESLRELSYKTKQI